MGAYGAKMVEELTVGLKSRIDDPNLWPYIRSIIEYIKGKGYRVKVDENMPLSGLETFKLTADDVSLLDLLIVVGGDGTLLFTLNHLRYCKPPIMTVRWGRYGFLMEIEMDEFQYYFERYINGNYKVRETSRIVGCIDSKEFPPALNEYLVVTKYGKVLRLELYKDSTKVFKMVGDGVIVASTTGSTAYSLSSGGPIVDEDLDLFVITPLNPIQLYLRPIVLPITSTLKIHILEDSISARLVIDGMEQGIIEPNNTVIIKQYDKIRFIRFKNDYYDRVLRRNII